MNSGFPNPYAFEHSDPETLEAELDQTIQDFEQMQAELGYQQAHSALETLVDKLDLSPRERAGLETEINSLQSMLDKLENRWCTSPCLAWSVEANRPSSMPC